MEDKYPPEMTSKGHLVTGIWTPKCICATNREKRGTPLMVQYSYDKLACRNALTKSCKKPVEARARR